MCFMRILVGFIILKSFIVGYSIFVVLFSLIKLNYISKIIFLLDFLWRKLRIGNEIIGNCMNVGVIKVEDCLSFEMIILYLLFY